MRIDTDVVRRYNCYMKSNACVEFGELVRNTRLKNGVSAREASSNCGMLPSNFSKLEHGALAPPKELFRQRKLASAIGIMPDSEDETTFFDSAARATGSVPVDIAEIISKDDAVPLLLRTIGNKRLSRGEITRIVEIVRGVNANTGIQQF